ncbi:MAG: ABC transporter C-terminal domain-containing protein [Verrucomicrobiota bacterium]
MGLLKKNPDPISDKARALSAEIAALEAEIKKLDSQLARPSEPKFRSTTTPAQGAIPRPAAKPAPTPKPSEPVFENIGSTRLTSRSENEVPELFNELGIRKYDLPALFNRLRNHLRGPTTSNPRLVNYLAAGGVQGLRPLRYEKRVARNRFIWLVVVVSFVLFGLFYWLLPKH